MSDKVQIEINQRRDVDVWVYHKDKGGWTLPDFTTSNYYIANGNYLHLSLFNRVCSYLQLFTDSSIRVLHPNLIL